MYVIVLAWAPELPMYSDRETWNAIECTLNTFDVVVAHWLADAVGFIDKGV
jgi:hypothetical protein